MIEATAVALMPLVAGLRSWASSFVGSQKPDALEYIIERRAAVIDRPREHRREFLCDLLSLVQSVEPDQMNSEHKQKESASRSRPSNIITLVWPQSSDEALPLAKQIAEALEAARTGHNDVQGGRRLWIRSDARY